MHAPAEPGYRPDALIARDIDAYLAQHQNKSMLRFITCGSVDDGKSTLIGRLLYESKMIFEDQLVALAEDSVGQLSGYLDLDGATIMSTAKISNGRLLTMRGTPDQTAPHIRF